MQRLREGVQSAPDGSGSTADGGRVALSCVLPDNCFLVHQCLSVVHALGRCRPAQLLWLWRLDARAMAPRILCIFFLCLFLHQTHYFKAPQLSSKRLCVHQRSS